MQKKAMNVIFCRFPIEWSRMTEIGSRAGGGIALQYSTWGIANFRAQSESPSGRPTATPTAEPMANPNRMRIRLGITSERNCAKSQRSRNSCAIVEGGGQNWLSRRPRPGLPDEHDRDGNRDLGREHQRPGSASAHAAPSRCDGCQRSARRSIAVKTMWVQIPSTPVAIASA